MDYEKIVDDRGVRQVAFGQYAGIAGEEGGRRGRVCSMKYSIGWQAKCCGFWVCWEGGKDGREHTSDLGKPLCVYGRWVVTSSGGWLHHQRKLSRKVYTHFIV